MSRNDLGVWTDVGRKISIGGLTLRPLSPLHDFRHVHVMPLHSIYFLHVNLE